MPASAHRGPPITEVTEAGPTAYQFQPTPKSIVTLTATVTQVTVFVGKIPPGLDDDVVRSLLALCGSLQSWRRVTDPGTSKPKAFGFADYANPLSVIRAIRLLNDFEVAGGKLLVKVDDKTQKVLDRFTNELSRADGDIQIAERERQLREEEDIRKAIMAELARNKHLVQHIETEDDIMKRLEEEENEERQREAERDERRKKRDYKVFLDRERAFEARERDRLIDRERARRPRREEEERAATVAKDSKLEADDDEYYRYEGAPRAPKPHRSRHSRDAGRASRRDREAAWDLKDRQAELAELNQAAKLADEERKRAEEAILMLQRKQQEEDEAKAAAELLEREKLARDLERAKAQQARKMQAMSRPLLTSGEKKRKTVEQAVVPGFNPNEDADEAAAYRPAKQRLTSLDIEIQKQKEVEEALEKAKQIVARIPKSKEEIFARPLDWELLEKHKILDTKIREWASGKVKKYLDEEEPALVEFIVAKLKEHLPPEQVLEDLRAVLDADADGFLLECWRRLLFEELRLKDQ